MIFSGYDKHHKPKFTSTYSCNYMSKSFEMSKAVHAIVICIIFTNASIQQNLETNNNGSLKGKNDITQ